MSELRLNYDLAGFHYKASIIAIRNRSIPAWLRYAPKIFLILFALSYLGLAIARSNGYPNAFAYIPVALILVCCAMLVVSFLIRKRLWKAVSEGTLRQGPTLLVTNDDGVTIENSACRTTVRWSAILDVVQGPDGLLLMVGGLEAFYIPASAFENKVAETEALKFMRSRLASSEVFA